MNMPLNSFGSYQSQSKQDIGMSPFTEKELKKFNSIMKDPYSKVPVYFENKKRGKIKFIASPRIDANKARTIANGQVKSKTKEIS